MLIKSNLKRPLLLISLCLFSISTLNAQHHIRLSNFRQLKKFFTYTANRHPLVSAHRGGIYLDLPENSLQAFQRSVQNFPAIIECDIAMTADSQLVLMHDDYLDRTSDGKGLVANKHSLELKSLFLRNNNRQLSYYRIPTLEQTLKWARDKAILMLDIKGNIPPQKIVAAIKAADATHYVVIISYDLPTAEKYHGLDRHLFHSLTISKLDDLPQYEQSRIPWSQMIFFVGVGHFSRELVNALHERKRFCILGSMGNTDRQAERFGASIYAAFFANGIDIISSDQPSQVYEAVKEHTPKNNPQQRYFHRFKNK